MTKRFGKRSKGAQQTREAQQDPRHMFGPPPLPRQSGSPASSTPLADYLAGGRPGVDQGYVVLPRSLAESMSLPWQQQLVNLLGQFHQAHGQLSWPAYRVVPSRRERLVDLDEDQLAEAGYLVEIDAAGELVYRERNGRQVDNPESTRVLVPCLDPVAQPQSASADTSGSGTTPESCEPAPMNVGPEPVWPAPSDATARDDSTPRQPDISEPDTPARGTPAPTLGVSSAEQQEGDARDWFAEMPPGQDRSGSASADGAPGTDRQQPDFGPTGQPTEIPYRYRGR